MGDQQVARRDAVMACNNLRLHSADRMDTEHPPAMRGPAKDLWRAVRFERSTTLVLFALVAGAGAALLALGSLEA